MDSLSFVIPCYNSSLSIEAVVDEIVNTMNSKQGYEYEIILINDNSSDNTLNVIRNCISNNNKIIAIDLAKNFGQHCAIMAGYSIAKGDLIITLDDDGQTPANEVFKLIDDINKGNDIVFAKYRTKKHSIFRNFGSFINDFMARKLINKPKNLYLSSYFVAKKFVIDELRKYKNAYPYISGLLLRTSNKISNVEVNHRDRDFGKSGYTFKKLLSLWMNGFTAFSIKPLRIASIIGAVIAGSGFIYGVWIIIKKFINQAVPMGYSSTMAALLFIGGVIMLMLGMIGEYIGRIYISINNAPQYVIRDIYHDNKIAEEK